MFGATEKYDDKEAWAAPDKAELGNIAEGHQKGSDPVFGFSFYIAFRRSKTGKDRV